MKLKQALSAILIIAQLQAFAPAIAGEPSIETSINSYDMQPDFGMGVGVQNTPLANLANDPNTIVLDDAMLEKLILTDNMDVTQTMDNVLRARDQMHIARSALLPSISLNMIISAFTSPMFLLSSVSCLVPFLFPTNWFALKASNKAYKAQIEALHLSKMNIYAAAQAMVYEVAGDEAVYSVMEGQRKRLADYTAGLEQQYQLALIPEVDAIRGRMEMNRVETDLLKTRQLVISERSTLRKLLGIGLEKQLVLKPLAQTPSKLEGQTAMATVASVALISPESTQLDLLAASAKASYHATAWSFLAGCSGSQGRLSGGAAAFSLTTGATVNLGFGYFPSLKLAKRNMSDIELRKKEVVLELGRVLETTLPAVELIKERQIRAQSNLDMTELLLKEQLVLLELGRVTVKDVLENFASAAAAQLEVVATQNALSTNRITLKRTGVEDRFLKILNDSRRLAQSKDFGKEPSKVGNFFRKVFHSGKKSATTLTNIDSTDDSVSSNEDIGTDLENGATEIQN